MQGFTGLLRTVAIAHDFARAGKLARGYTWLLEGLHEAEAEVRQGRLWANELVDRYMDAIDTYIKWHGVPIK